MGLLARRIGVADLERSRNFYKSVFGFLDDGKSFSRSGVAAGAPTARALVQRLIDSKGAVIELIQMEAPGADRTPKVYTIGHYGLTHLAFLVESLDNTRARILSHGGTALDHTRVPMIADWSGMYVADPDGTRIEIVEGTGMAPLLSHSGITVRSLADSIAYYERFGFKPAESYDMREPQSWMAQLNEMPGIALFAQMVRDDVGNTLQLLDITAPAIPSESRAVEADSLGFFELLLKDGAECGVQSDPNGVRIATMR